jgi:hypothetical protein
MRIEFEVTTTSRTWSTKYNGKTIKAKDARALDKALDDAGAPRPRTLRVVKSHEGTRP